MIFRRGTTAFLSLAVLLTIAPAALAARQSIALFPPGIHSAESDNTLRPAVPVIAQTLKERLSDRFDVRTAEEGKTYATDEARLRAARSLRASYVLTGNLSRIGKAVTLDITIGPVEEQSKGRTVVVSGVLENPSAASPGDLATFRRMGMEAALKTKYIFFGDERIGEGPSAKKVPVLAGVISRSSPLPGDVVSVSISDIDLDGRLEVVAAISDTIVVYRIEGDELFEKARIPNAGSGIVHVDAADLDRNGVAEIIAVRYAGGKALSDIWQFDGSEYRKKASDLPYFLRSADLGPEGIVLLGQAPDPDKVYRGPVFRIGIDPQGQAEIKDRDRPLPLPAGTFLYGFTSLRKGKGIRFAVLTARNRLVYLDGNGTELWEGLDAVNGTDVYLEGTGRRLRMPGRLAAVDLDRDGTDELLVLSDMVEAGTYFENLRIFSEAEILCFAQGDGGMQLAWRSPQIDATARDILVERPPYPKPFRIAVASRDREKIIGDGGQWRIIWIK